MTFERWLLAYAETAQYAVYLFLLVLLGGIESRLSANDASPTASTEVA